MDAGKWFDESLTALNKMAPENVDFLFLSMTKSEWASWTQAVGAIASIWIAWIISRHSDQKVYKRNVMSGKLTSALNVELFVSTADLLKSMIDSFNKFENFDKTAVEAFERLYLMLHLPDEVVIQSISYANEKAAIHLADGVCKLQMGKIYLSRVKVHFELTAEQWDDKKSEFVHKSMLEILAVLSMALYEYKAAYEEILKTLERQLRDLGEAIERRENI
jgi:hypothetical protein